MIGNTIRAFNGARLGNQMFQIGMLYSIWKKTNQPFFQIRKNEQFWNCFDVDIPDNGIVKQYKGNYGCPFEFYQDVYNVHVGTEFNGYFQNKLYIEEYREELINFFKFKKEHSDFVDNEIEKFKKEYNLPLVAVHYRRGDFVLPNAEEIWGNLYKSNYYTNCFNNITEPCLYLIFSDDISWCREILKFDNIKFIEMDEYKSLYLMTKTDTNIIANSTFSWFGAFLNTNKNNKVYLPSKWAGNRYNYNCKVKQNFCLTNWNLIEMEYNQ